NLDYSRVDMRGAAYEAVFIYCECVATKQIGSPVGLKRPKIIVDRVKIVKQQSSTKKPIITISIKINNVKFQSLS
ncbi:MAG: hypothetical protein KAX11_02845, partial [Candidatus Aminicenantes bacterium]|nr:hypothetical protein [Candidatus Aminicenantes bacterium]